MAPNLPHEVLLSVHSLSRTVDNQQSSGQKTTVWRGISFDVCRGDIMFLRGPSGVGKTLLLRTLACLDPVEVRQVLGGPASWGRAALGSPSRSGPPSRLLGHKREACICKCRSYVPPCLKLCTSADPKDSPATGPAALQGGLMQLHGKSPSEVGIPCWRAQVGY